MTWTTPFFLHLRVPAAAVAERIPSGLTLETEGQHAFVSVVAVETTGPAPSPIAQSRLGRLFAYRQLNVRTYVSGPHGPGLFFLDLRVDRPYALAGRALGFPYRLDRRLAFSADPSGVALRARGVAVKGLPAPGDAKPLDDALERRLLDRYWSYARLPVGGLVAARIEHAPWRVRRVEVDPDLRLEVAFDGATPVSAQLGESLDVAIAELKIYRANPFKEARAA